MRQKFSSKFEFDENFDAFAPALNFCEFDDEPLILFLHGITILAEADLEG